ncbi:MAG: ATP-binding protein [Paludibacteraceae bacterium]|nr:ATP-binding protein [Paludibacteraceae bacterium]
MLYRKISKYILDFLRSGNDKILLIEGARQIGKSFIIRQVGKQVYPYFIEVNFVEDDEGPQLFKNIHNIDDFYFALSSVAGNSLHSYEDTLIFLDEIQHYPQYLTLLKFLRQDHRFRFIASGSLLGLTLRKTTSIPVGSIIRKRMYQLDFEEWLLANGYGADAIGNLKDAFLKHKSLTEEQHNYLMSLFKRYLLVGGLPDAVNIYLSTHNIASVREVQNSIMDLYREDAAKYESEAGRKLHILRLYNMIPSQMENKKKRVVVKDIQGKKGDRYDNYTEEFEYLVSSGIVNEVNAISNPRYPLSESLHKNLLKLYLNDVGLLTAQLYKMSIKAVMETEMSVNLGSVYESVVAQELCAHGFPLFYYDNKSKGEVDFLIDDVDGCCVTPIEVKSGKDYKIHSALNAFISDKEYGIKESIVFSNSRQIELHENMLYLPIYFVMFVKMVDATDIEEKDLIF